MSTDFKPAIYNGTDLVFFPRPVRALDCPWTWENDIHSVPKSQSEVIYPNRIIAPTISFAGQVTEQDGTTLSTESEMWDAMMDFITKMNALTVGGGKLELFFYYNASTPAYVKLKQVVPVKFSPGIGDDVWPSLIYTATFKTGDPNVYTTAPGV